ncbi:MAG: prepilin peptidase [Gammaproteobacteria bacterium]|nr:prepilin peptidase [Gammaproteobacteria bacterium]
MPGRDRGRACLLAARNASSNPGHPTRAVACTDQQSRGPFIVQPLIDLFRESPTFWIACSTFLGLCVGSFLNVVAYRLPIMMERRWRNDCGDYLADLSVPDTLVSARDELAPILSGVQGSEPAFDLVKPRSACPACGHAIKARENIPVLSWLLLGGRCSACRTRIPVRYPLVELTGAALAALAAWHFGFGAQAAWSMLLLWALLALSLIDLDRQLLPDDIVLPTLWLGLGVNLFGVFVPLQDAVIGAIAGYGVLRAVFELFKLATGKEGMGFGDFKLLAMLGAWMGWQQLPTIIIISSVVGAVIGITLILVRGQDKNVPIPFGPFIAMGGIICLFWGDTLIHTYLGKSAW